MTRTCYEGDDPAPRPGCKCEECYRARERHLDPALVALTRGRGRGTGLTCTPSQGLIHQGITRYLMGDVEMGSMYILIIEALAKQNDEIFNNLLHQLTKEPRPPLTIVRVQG